MGQQQLLLLILGVLLVMLASILGLGAFSESKKKGNLDALVQDATTIACDAQIWRWTPAINGGGASNPPGDMWAGLTFKRIGYNTNASNEHANAHGLFTFETDGNLLTVTGTNAEYGNQVIVEVTGLKIEDFDVTVDGSYSE